MVFSKRGSPVLAGMDGHRQVSMTVRAARDAVAVFERHHARNEAGANRDTAQIFLAPGMLDADPIRADMTVSRRSSGDSVTIHFSRRRSDNITVRLATMRELFSQHQQTLADRKVAERTARPGPMATSRADRERTAQVRRKVLTGTTIPTQKRDTANLRGR